MFTYDLVDLRLFSAAARAGSVSQAASEVHLAVSSASARLKAFEARSGVKLFERRPHGVDLTPAGVETVHAVRAMLHDAEVLESVLTRFRRNHQEVCVAAHSQCDDGWLGRRRQCLFGAKSRGEHQTH